MQDPAILSLAGVAVAAFSALIGGVLSKRISSQSETQTALNESFKSFMTASEADMKRLREAHGDCEKRVSSLRSIIIKLVRVLREQGIPLPHFTNEENYLMLEHRSFEGNGLTPHAPQEE